MRQDKSISIELIVTLGHVPTALTTTQNLCLSMIASVRKTSILITALFTCLTVVARPATNRRTSSACTQTATWSAILALEFLERNS
jgi:hypothetical protein